MTRTTFFTISLLAILSAPLPCRAQWGWPPPGYSCSGVSASDNSHYRGLLARWRDRRRDCGCGGPAVEAFSATPSGAVPPGTPAAAPGTPTVPPAPTIPSLP
jgi:hypothetical protein